MSSTALKRPGGHGMGLVAAMALSVAAVIVVASGVRPAAAVETCRTIPATIVGTEGDDVLTGTEHVDVIVGLGGNDTIITKEGSDVVCEGAGNDTVLGNAGGDYVVARGG